MLDWCEEGGGVGLVCGRAVVCGLVWGERWCGGWCGEGGGMGAGVGWAVEWGLVWERAVVWGWCGGLCPASCAPCLCLEGVTP